MAQRWREVENTLEKYFSTSATLRNMDFISWDSPCKMNFSRGNYKSDIWVRKIKCMNIKRVKAAVAAMAL